MLQEQDRQKLDGIVQQMTTNKESDANIQAVVDDFKSKYDKPTIGAPTTQTTQGTSPMGYLTGGITGAENMIPGMESFAKGVLKSGAGAIQGLINIGGKLGRWAGEKLTGDKGYRTEPIPQLFKPEQLQPKGTAETIGKIGGDIAQFFIPGGLEEAAAGKLEGVLDTAKLTEKFGKEAAGTIENLWKIAAKGLTTGLSTQAVSEVQTGGKAGLGYGVVGFLGGAAGKALEMFGPELSKAIEKSNFKLTPLQKTRLATKIESASSFISDNKILGSETSKYQKLTDINSKMEDAMQKSLGEESQTQIMVQKNQLIKEIKNAPEKFKTEDPAIYQEAKNDADRAIKTLKETKGNEVSLDTVLNGKRSYGSRAFTKGLSQRAGGPLVSEGDYAIEQAYQNVLGDAMNRTGYKIQVPKDLQTYFGGKTEVDLSEFNKVYSQAINAKKFTAAAQFKKDTGLVGRLFGLWAGETVGQAISPGLGGKIIGGALGEISSTKVPGIVRNIGQRIATGGATTIPTTVKTIQGLIPKDTINP